MALPSRAALGEHAQSTHNTAEHGRGSAAMGRDQPHAGAPCSLQMRVTKPRHFHQSPGCRLCWSCPGPSSTWGCRLVPREGVTSWDRTAGNPKCRCWSPLWSRPGYPAWQPSHFSETLSIRPALEDQRKKLIKA